MRIEQAAERLGISVRNLHRLIKNDRIRATKRTIPITIIRPTKVWDVDEGSVMEYLRKQELQKG
jgi:predicted site-specific integrase-resolvase